MLNFKKIDLSDFSKIQEIMKDNRAMSCENSIINLIIWEKAYNNMYAVCDGMLFLKSGKGKSQSFALPIGGVLKKGIHLIFKYTYPEKPYFWTQDGDNIEKFRAIVGESYDISPERDAFDYI